MSGTALTANTTTSRRYAVRWSGSVLLALLLHISVLIWLSYYEEDTAQEAPPPAMMLMVAEQIQSTATPRDVPLGPQQTLSEPQESTPDPLEKSDAPLPVAEPAPTPAMAVATTPRPKAQPVREKTKKTEKAQPAPAQQVATPVKTPPAPTTSAPLAGNQTQVAAPYTSDAAQMRRGVADWSSRVLAHLGRYKRYPPQAARQRLEGVAQIRVTLDRQGNILSVALFSSSGVTSLDQESVALPQRAQPLPAPPVDVIGEKTQLAITIPIRYDLREFRY